MPSRASRPSIAEILAALAGAALEAGVRWYLCGSQAALAWGKPRPAGDIAVTVDAAGRPTGEILDAFAAHGLEARFPLSDELLATLRLLPIEHAPSRTPIDLVLAAPGLEAEFLDRARQIRLGGVTVPVISPEDLVAVKLLGGRRKDLEDVQGILAVQAERLDLARARAVLQAFEAELESPGLVARLDAALRAREKAAEKNRKKWR